VLTGQVMCGIAGYVWYSGTSHELSVRDVLQFPVEI